MLYTTKFDVPEDEDYTIPFGQARMVSEGDDITVVTNSIMTVKAEKAIKKLQKEGISVDHIDLRTIVPLDTDTIIKSVKKTGKLLIVDEGHESFGISGEIATRIMPEVFWRSGGTGETSRYGRCSASIQPGSGVPADSG
ncbi:MAG: transketolase C-terminal domain-containing protein [Eubacterium ramulus]